MGKRLKWFPVISIFCSNLHLWPDLYSHVPHTCHNHLLYMRQQAYESSNVCKPVDVCKCFSNKECLAVGLREEAASAADQREGQSWRRSSLGHGPLHRCIHITMRETVLIRVSQPWSLVCVRHLGSWAAQQLSRKYLYYLVSRLFLILSLCSWHSKFILIGLWLGLYGGVLWLSSD